MSIYEKIKNIKKREAYQIELNDEISADIKKLVNGSRQYSGYEIGYHWPSGANWCYTVQLISYNGRLYEIVTRFGECLHAACVSIYDYKDQK